MRQAFKLKLQAPNHRQSHSALVYKFTRIYAYPETRKHDPASSSLTTNYGTTNRVHGTPGRRQRDVDINTEVLLSSSR